MWTLVAVVQRRFVGRLLLRINLLGALFSVSRTHWGHARTWRLRTNLKNCTDNNLSKVLALSTIVQAPKLIVRRWENYSPTLENTSKLVPRPLLWSAQCTPARLPVSQVKVKTREIERKQQSSRLTWLCPFGLSKCAACQWAMCRQSASLMDSSSTRSYIRLPGSPPLSVILEAVVFV